MGFTTEAVRIHVPASSANLGPGFDSLGLALDVFDELVAMVTEDEGVLVEVAGEGADAVPRDESHLVVRAMNRAFDLLGERPAGFILRCRNSIPHGRGLGSSAAAIIGGMALARALVDEGSDRLSDVDLLSGALALENHPDNLAAALYGGFTISWLEAASNSPRAGSVRVDVHPDIAPVIFVPDSELSTAAARSVLPEMITMRDASFNLSRTGLLAHALAHRPDLLFQATADTMHQEHRREVYPQTLELVDALRGEGLAAVVSGAGPSVLVLGHSSSHRAASVGSFAGAQWRCVDVPVAQTGAIQTPV